MKLVTFARAVAPHGAGDKRVVTDEVADRLRADGALSDEEPWPAMQGAQQPRAPARKVVKPQRPAGVPDRRRAR